MKKKLCMIVCICIVLFSAAALYADEIMVNAKKVQEGDSVNLFRKDLVGGKIEFSVSKKNLEKAEISLDEGRTWEEMERENDNFFYKYRPRSDEKIYPEFMFTFEDSTMRTFQPGIAVNYQRHEPEDAVLELLNKLRTYYEGENIGRFMGLFASRYPDRVKFRQSIQNDFHNYNNIRLHYRVDRKTFDRDYESAVWDVYLERKYSSRTGSGFSDSARISMRAEKERNTWLISGLANNTIFGSSLLSSADLVITSDKITAPAAPDGSVTAVIKNKGNANAGSFKIKFYLSAPGPKIETGYENVSALKAGSEISVTHTFPLPAPDVPYTVTVTVDPENKISESKENNNQASRTFK
ncbi:MAG: hypothetical protein JSW18_00140 [Candidatus Omnitrophota bacterium]|nr:MAG: hypothetical protein JSW18_00140 [Candidatus Omnitrophota bacterium]